MTSAVWLLVISTAVVGFIHTYGGVRRWLVRTSAAFIPRHYVWLDPHSSGTPTLTVGYRLFGKRLHLLQIGTDGIRSVEWSAGQGSDMSGRDLNDWHVALWFDVIALRSPLTSHFVHGSEGIDIIGPADSQSRTADLGRRFIAFLKTHGVTLIQMGEQPKFIQPDSQHGDSEQSVDG